MSAFWTKMRPKWSLKHEMDTFFGKMRPNEDRKGSTLPENYLKYQKGWYGVNSLGLNKFMSTKGLELFAKNSHCVFRYGGITYGLKK